MSAPYIRSLHSFFFYRTSFFFSFLFLRSNLFWFLLVVLLLVVLFFLLLFISLIFPRHHCGTTYLIYYTKHWNDYEVKATRAKSSKQYIKWKLFHCFINYAAPVLYPVYIVWLNTTLTVWSQQKWTRECEKLNKRTNDKINNE